MAGYQHQNERPSEFSRGNRAGQRTAIDKEIVFLVGLVLIVFGEDAIQPCDGEFIFPRQALAGGNPITTDYFADDIELAGMNQKTIDGFCLGRFDNV